MVKHGVIALIYPLPEHLNRDLEASGSERKSRPQREREIRSQKVAKKHESPEIRTDAPGVSMPAAISTFIGTNVDPRNGNGIFSFESG